MTIEMLLYLAPIIVVGLTVLVLMLSVAIYRSFWMIFCLSLFGIFCAFAFTFCPGASAVKVTDLFIIDRYGVFGIRLILAATFAIVVFAFEYLKNKNEEKEEFYILLLMSCLGAVCMVVSNHFMSFFLGLEILTVPIYALIAYIHQRSNGVEAAIKYVILAGASAAFLLFGMLLIYAQLGNMRFDVIAENWAPMWSSGKLVLLMGLSFIVVGISFKLSAFPFHMWAPDVYQGAPLPVTAYLATVSKAAMMILFLRFFIQINGNGIFELQWLLSSIAVLSMFVGNWLALLQKDLKRLLAYSSIAHMGYMFAAILSGDALGGQAVLFYLGTYIAASLLAFGTLVFLKDENAESVTVESMRGLFYVKPYLSGCLIFALLSFVGIPLTAGFMGKYWILLSGVSSGKWNLLFSLVISTSIGLYAYLKIVVVLFQSSPQKDFPSNAAVSRILGVTLGVLVIVTLALGIAPDSFTNAIQVAVESL